MHEQHLDYYFKLKRNIEDWLMHLSGLSEAATILRVTPSSLYEMLGWAGMADVTGRAEEGVTYQDVLFCILTTQLMATRKDLTKRLMTKTKKGN